MKEVEIHNLALTGDELQLIVTTLIHKQELLLKLKLDDAQPSLDYDAAIESYSHLINKLERQSRNKPVAPAPATAQTPPQEKIFRIPPPVKPQTAKSLTDVRLLIVDDNADFTKLMSDFLLEMGLGRVDHTHNGVNALAMIRQANPPYNLVICDWRMPKKDGIEVLREIRADPRCASLAFIMISGFKGGEKVRAAIELGVNDFLVKPVYPEDILNKIRQTFNLENAAA